MKALRLICRGTPEQGLFKKEMRYESLLGGRERGRKENTFALVDSVRLGRSDTEEREKGKEGFHHCFCFCFLNPKNQKKHEKNPRNQKNKVFGDFPVLFLSFNISNRFQFDQNVKQDFRCHNLKDLGNG